jgi:site-specific DNA-methyltransferase (adenine-specific)
MCSGLPGDKTRQIIFSVKAGRLKPDDVRALGGVVDREKAAIGVLISFEEPTKKMRSDTASAGFVESAGVNTQSFSS